MARRGVKENTVKEKEREEGEKSINSAGVVGGAQIHPLGGLGRVCKYSRMR